MKKIILMLFIIITSAISINAQEVIVTSYCETQSGMYTTHKMYQDRYQQDCFKPQEFAQPMRIMPNNPINIIVDVEEKQKEPIEIDIYTGDNTWKDKPDECVDCREYNSQKIVNYQNSKWERKPKIIQYVPSCFIQG